MGTLQRSTPKITLGSNCLVLLLVLQYCENKYFYSYCHNNIGIGIGYCRGSTRHALSVEILSTDAQNLKKLAIPTLKVIEIAAIILGIYHFLSVACTIVSILHLL